MFNAALEAASEQGNTSALLRQFMHQLAMHKTGLERDDFKNRDQYEKLVSEKSKLTEQLTEAQADSEKKVMIESLKVIQKELDNLNSYFDTKFGVGISLKTRFEAYDDYRKTFEIYFLATRENVLLSTWELSLTTAGGAAINVFCNLISPPDKGIIDYIMKPVDKLVEWSTWALSLGQHYQASYDSISLVSLLDEVLNKIEDSSFDKTKFMKEFSINFHKKFNERIDQRFSGGVLTMYDKTRNLTSIDLSKPLTDAKSMCEAIFSVAYQAIENIKIENPVVKEKIIHELSIAIQGQPNSDSKNSEFFLKLMLVWLRFFGSGSIEPDLVKRENQFWKSFDSGGSLDNTLNNYLGKSHTTIQLSRDPKSFIKQLVAQLNTMIQNGTLDNIDPEVEIIFPMTAPGHAFLLRPDMAMLAEVMKNPDPKAVEAWITKTLIDDRKTFFVADLNWKEAKGEHDFLAIRKNLNSDKLELIILDEHENAVETNYKPTEFSVSFLANS